MVTKHTENICDIFALLLIVILCRDPIVIQGFLNLVEEEFEFTFIKLNLTPKKYSQWESHQKSTQICLFFCHQGITPKGKKGFGQVISPTKCP